MTPYLIAIAGPSGAGKSYLARPLAEQLQALVIGLDSYYCELPGTTYEQRCGVNFDDPATIDFPLLLEHLNALLAGRSIKRPTYDFSTHLRTRDTALLAPRPYVVIEGLFTLHSPELRRLASTRVFVDLPDDLCYRRRLERDVRERGRTPASVERQYAATVRPMADRYIRPTRRFANLVIPGDAPLETSLARVLGHVRGEHCPAAPATD